MNTPNRLLIISLALASSAWLLQSQAETKSAPAIVPGNTVDLLRKALKNGTPIEKRDALNTIRSLKPIQLIPDITEAIEDPTPLPREGDTGWGFVGHQAASTMNEIARAIDGMDVNIRGNGYDAYSFHNDQYKGGQKLKELKRLSEVRLNWTKWWQSRGETWFPQRKQPVPR